MLVDAHVHAFPERLALAVRARLSGDGLVALTDGPLLPDVAQSVTRRGFDFAWILPYAHKAGVAASINDWSAAEVDRYPCLVAGATFHPDDPDLEAIVHHALVVLGLRVVKLHCSVGQFSPSDPRLEPLWQTASQRRVPIVIHAGQRDGGRTAEDEVTRLQPVLSEHPQLNVVLAHAGFPAIQAALELMQAYPNLHADLTPVWTSPIAPPEVAMERFGDRILYGSDAPNSPLSHEDQLRHLEALGLSERVRAAVLGGNAMRLVPMDGADA